MTQDESFLLQSLRVTVITSMPPVVTSSSSSDWIDWVHMTRLSRLWCAGPAACPSPWWWPSWHEWRRGWCPRTVPPCRPRTPPAWPAGPTIGSVDPGGSPEQSPAPDAGRASSAATTRLTSGSVGSRVAPQRQVGSVSADSSSFCLQWQPMQPWVWQRFPSHWSHRQGSCEPLALFEPYIFLFSLSPLVRQ